MTDDKPVRHAIWAAVSSEEQAREDKFSLITQEEAARKMAQKNGWQETSGPYVVPGESRTRYVNLSDAEREMPALRQLLDDAKAGLFDVLVCYEFDRFRDLLDPIARTLGHYGVQLVSVSQPHPIIQPEEYSPYASDSEFILRSMGQITSRMAITNLRRKYLTQMPKRVTEKGLPAASYPWGYRKPPGRERDADAVLELIPEIKPYLVRMKDMILAGKSTYQIKDELERLGAPVPKRNLRKKAGDEPMRTEWDPTTIARILRNPFYAGWVSWGKTKVHRDLRTGAARNIPQPDEKVITARGKHEPVWDDDTYQAIITEMDRRRPWLRGHVTRQLSGLMRCAICDAVLWRHSLREKRPVEERVIAWRCSKSHASHMVHTNDAMLAAVAAKLEEIIYSDTTENPEIERPSHAAELADLETRRKRIADAYEAGLFEIDEFSRRVSQIDREIKRLAALEADAQAALGESKIRNQSLEALRAILPEIGGLLLWLREADFQETNKILSYIVDYFVVDKQGEIIKTVLK
jgi:hypothetical protein